MRPPVYRVDFYFRELASVPDYKPGFFIEPAYTAADAVFQVELKLKFFGYVEISIREVQPWDYERVKFGDKARPFNP